VVGVGEMSGMKMITNSKPSIKRAENDLRILCTRWDNFLASLTSFMGSDNCLQIHREEEKQLKKSLANAKMHIDQLVGTANRLIWNPFVIGGFQPSENDLSRVLASLLNPNAPHRLGFKPLQLFLQKLNDMHHTFPIIKPTKPEIQQIHVRIDKKVEDTRPDIEICGPNFLIFIENKIRGGTETLNEKGFQTTRQFDALKKKCQDLAIKMENAAIVFLTPEGKLGHQSGVFDLSVNELVEAFRPLSKADNRYDKMIAPFFEFYQQYS
jgi:hypothetical protein